LDLDVKTKKSSVNESIKLYSGEGTDQSD